MALKIFADSWAVIELLRGSEKAKEIKERFKSADELLYSPLIASEIFYRISEEKGEKAAMETLEDLKSKMRFCELSIDVAVEAGKIHLIEKLPLIDAFTLAIARKEGARVLTGDPHFRKVREAIYVGD
ncbi:MAG TPA: PIN domain-containing protein [Candidatus Norongarragalinales archaeon]|nr:PIN domain-containing protein [Candidatus Norongarragalinales archaeon]